MSELFDAARDAAATAARGFLCGAGAALGIYNDVAGKVNRSYDYTIPGLYGDRLANALRGFCPRPSPDGPGDFVPEPPPPPFSGGQCECVSYEVTYTFTSLVPGSTPRTFTGRYRGPIGPVAIAYQAIPNTTRRQAGFFYGAEACGGRQFELLQGYDPEQVSGRPSVVINSVSRVDGQPDNCGDPSPNPDDPPTFPDPSPPPSPTPPPTPGPSIDWPGIGPITPILAPVVGIIYIDADANVRIPVTVNVDLPDVDINFDFNFDVNISDPTEPPKPLPDKPGERDDDRPEKPDCPPPPECDEEPEEKEPDEPIPAGSYAAAIVTTVEIDPTEQMKATAIWQEEAPPIYAPNCGYLHIAYGKSEDEQTFGVDIPLKKLVQVHPNPVPEAPIFRAVVVPAKGFKLPFESLGYAVISAPKCNCP